MVTHRYRWLIRPEWPFLYDVNAGVCWMRPDKLPFLTEVDYQYDFTGATFSPTLVLRFYIIPEES